MPNLCEPNLSYMVANKHKNNPHPNRSERWRKGQGRFGGCGLPRENRNNDHVMVPRSLRGHKPPGHPPALRVRPTTPSRRWVRADAPRKRAGGQGGLRVGRPYFPILTYTQERCKMQENSRRNPQPDHPKTRNRKEKTRQGEPHQPERNAKRH